MARGSCSSGLLAAYSADLELLSPISGRPGLCPGSYRARSLALEMRHKLCLTGVISTFLLRPTRSCQHATSKCLFLEHALLSLAYRPFVRLGCCDVVVCVEFCTHPGRDFARLSCRIAPSTNFVHQSGEARHTVRFTVLSTQSSLSPTTSTSSSQTPPSIASYAPLCQ